MLGNLLARYKWLVIAIFILLVISVGLFVMTFNKTDDSDEAPQQEFLGSMEGGSPITEEDQEELKSQVDFSVDNALSIVKTEYPEAQSILLRFTEWYYTEENENSNILVVFNVADSNGSVSTVMRVIEFITQDSTLRLVSSYEPDERYSIYE